MPSLADAYARLERADEHLREVHALAQQICTAQAEATRVQVAPGMTLMTGELGQVFSVESANTPIVARLSVLVGDSVNSLRSCLDYLVGELAELDSGSRKSRTQFPVEQSADAFSSRRQSFLNGVPVMRQFLDVVYQAVELPLCIHLLLTPERKAVELFVVPQVAEYRLHRGKAPA